MVEMSFTLISDDNMNLLKTSIRSPQKKNEIEREQAFSIYKDTKSITPTYNGIMLPHIVRAFPSTCGSRSKSNARPTSLS